MNRKRVIIIGGGFGGVAAAESLSALDLDILLIDRRNFHLFQPLLYQVAMAGLNPADISVPLRTLFRNKKNIQVVLAEVEKINCAKKQICFDNKWISYDYLVLGCGVKHSYFGKPDWEDFAPGLKNIEQAIEIRRRVLTAFELAEKADDPVERQKCLSFVIVGGGPTGVELAGAIAEMASHALRDDFNLADLTKTRVILVESGPRVLAAFPEPLSLKAKQDLEKLGVEVMINSRATDLSYDGITVDNQFISAKTILWAAGVAASSISSFIPGEKDKIGRVKVNKDLSVPGYPDVFVIGDQAAFATSEDAFLPGIAPIALQQGRFLRKVLRADFNNKTRPAFKYKDKGIMATIGRTRAVAQTFGINSSGLVAWLAWVFIHIVFLMRFKNRFFVLLQWVWAYFTFGSGARLITYKTWRFYSGEKIQIDDHRGNP